MFKYITSLTLAAVCLSAADNVPRVDLHGAAFIRRAKAAGAKFSIGSHRHAQGIGEIEYCLGMARNCGLTAKDFFVPSRDLGK